MARFESEIQFYKLGKDSTRRQSIYWQLDARLMQLLKEYISPLKSLYLSLSSSHSSRNVIMVLYSCNNKEERIVISNSAEHTVGVDHNAAIDVNNHTVASVITTWNWINNLNVEPISMYVIKKKCLLLSYDCECNQSVSS